MNTINFSNAIILLYHGVTTEKCTGVRNSSAKHIYLHDFNRQMKYIKENCNILSLRELISKFEDRCPLPEKTVVVTI